MTFTEFLTQASQPMVEKIRRDKERVEGRVLALLECLETHVFDPDCNVNFMKRTCAFGDNSVVISFHQSLGIPPKLYLTSCRLETAARLLQDSSLKVYQIAELVGFSLAGVFSRAFLHWSGMRPTDFRKHGENTPWFSSDFLARAIIGGLKPDEAQRLIQHLQTLYPQVQDYPVAA